MVLCLDGGASTLDMMMESKQCGSDLTMGHEGCTTDVARVPSLLFLLQMLSYALLAARPSFPFSIPLVRLRCYIRAWVDSFTVDLRRLQSI